MLGYLSDETVRQQEMAAHVEVKLMLLNLSISVDVSLHRCAAKKRSFAAETKQVQDFLHPALLSGDQGQYSQRWKPGIRIPTSASRERIENALMEKRG